MRQWYRRVYLRSWAASSWQWSRDGKQFASANVQSSQYQVVLRYRVSHAGGDWQDVEEPVAITWTRCFFGGVRPWFVCPAVVNGVPCRRRCAILYSGGGIFACRRCYNLAYQSQREDYGHQAMRRAQAIRQRLGGSANLFEPFPVRPKGARRKTYWRLWASAQEAEARFLSTVLGPWL